MENFYWYLLHAMILNSLSQIIRQLQLRWRTVFLTTGFLLIGPTVIVADQTSSPTPVLSSATPVPEGKISLESTANKRLPNTVADVVLAIQLTGRTMDSVSSSLAQHSQTLLDFLRQQGVERLRTEQVSYEPETQPVKGGPDQIVGYSGYASVSFRTVPEKLGALLTGALENGANTVSQILFSPSESETDAARRDLAIEATKAALARADAIARAVGERVVRIESIDVAPEQGILPLSFRAAKAEVPAASIPTVAGEQEVSVRVSVQVATRMTE